MADLGDPRSTMLLNGLAAAQTRPPSGGISSGGDVKGELLGQVFHALGIPTVAERDATASRLRGEVFTGTAAGEDMTGIAKELVKKGYMHDLDLAVVSGLTNSDTMKQIRQGRELKLQQGDQALGLLGQLKSFIETQSPENSALNQRFSESTPATAALPTMTPAAARPATPDEQLSTRANLPAQYQEAAIPGQGALAAESQRTALGRATLKETVAGRKAQQKAEEGRTQAILDDAHSRSAMGFYDTGEMPITTAVELADVIHGRKALKDLSPDALKASKASPAQLADLRGRTTAATDASLKADMAANALRLAQLKGEGPKNITSLFSTTPPITNQGVQDEFDNIYNERDAAYQQRGLPPPPRPSMTAMAGGGDVVARTGPTKKMPKPGDVLDGHRFKGGNPADPSAWEQVP